MLDVTFVNACLQLSKGYIDALKLFIVAAQTAYKMNISIESMLQTLAGDDDDESFSKAANRNLVKEEILLRTVWIYLVYLTLESLHIPKNSDTNTIIDSDDDNEGSASMALNDIKEMHKEYASCITKNWKMENINEKTKFSIVSDLKVDDVIQNCKINASNTSIGDNTMIKAMLPQNIRVLILTLVVLEEEKLCLDSEDFLIKKINLTFMTKNVFTFESFMYHFRYIKI